MTTILEELKSRLTASQKRHADAQQRFQSIQVELQAATAEFNIWNTAYNLESREESIKSAARASHQIPMELGTEALQENVEEHIPEEVGEAVNKTELIREMLRQHPTGILPADLWKGFQQQAPGTSRQYLYSVLKRLRDRDYVCVRRGKYMLKSKPQEVASEAVIIQ